MSHPFASPQPHHPPPSHHHPPERPKKKRIRHWTAEDRAVHREFEKSRREAFSERLMELASLLPMPMEARPSKHVIVGNSITHHKAQSSRLALATGALSALLEERDDLLREVNGLRALCQPAASVPREARSVDPAVLEMLATDSEQSSSFVDGNSSGREAEDILNPGLSDPVNIASAESPRAPVPSMPSGVPLSVPRYSPSTNTAHQPIYDSGSQQSSNVNHQSDFLRSDSDPIRLLHEGFLNTSHVSDDDISLWFSTARDYGALDQEILIPELIYNQQQDPRIALSAVNNGPVNPFSS